MTGVQTCALPIYQEEKATVKVLGKNLPGLEAQLQESKDEMELIIKKLGIELQTKEAVVNKAMEKIANP